MLDELEEKFKKKMQKCALCVSNAEIADILLGYVA